MEKSVMPTSTPYNRSSRRDFLYAGWLGGLGLTVGDFLRIRSAAAADATSQSATPKAQSVIYIYLNGGFAHMDSFDP